MMKNKTTQWILLTAALAFACPSISMAGEHQIIEIGQRPESVTKGFDGHYYATVMMGNEQPGDAVIKVIKDGEVSVFAKGMDEPKGIAFTGNHLLTTDLDRVWKVDPDGKTSVLVDKSDFLVRVSYLNDAAVSQDGKTLFVSDMGANTKMFGPDGLWPLGSPQAKRLPAIGRIFQIDPNDGKVNILIDPSDLMPCPNGVAYAGEGKLLMADFFTGKILLAEEGEVKVITSGYRGGDGIEQDANGNIYISSWTQGKVWRMDSQGENAEVILEGLQSAADFYLDQEENKLLVPDMLAGTIHVLPLADE